MTHHEGVVLPLDAGWMCFEFQTSTHSGNARFGEGGGDMERSFFSLHICSVLQRGDLRIVFRAVRNPNRSSSSTFLIRKAPELFFVRRP